MVIAPVVVTAPTGNVGRHVVGLLLSQGVKVRAAVRPGERTRVSPSAGGACADEVAFDFTDPDTWPAVFDGASTLFLVRPPALVDVRRNLLPAVAAARDAGVGHVVFLSLQGAQHNPLVPHRTVEKWLLRSGMGWTFVRASFFLQNLSTTHASDILQRDEIVVPAGNGRTAFVDAADVAAVAAAALVDPAAHRYRAWTPTGPEALTYGEVAEVLTEVLGRPIRYSRPGLVRYLRHARSRLGMPWGMALVTGAIYTAARLGRAAALTDDVRAVTHLDPVGVREFAEREQAAWRR
ncbi:MAG: NmrA family NAD(P)-binding protein [Kineosporiaceae bacterium]